METVTKRMCHRLLSAIMRQCHKAVTQPNPPPGLATGLLALLTLPWRVYDYPPGPRC